MHRTVRSDDLVGAAEIAKRLGVGTSVVRDWRRRGLGFPDAIAELEMGGVWVWSDVEAWARRTGRLDD